MQATVRLWLAAALSIGGLSAQQDQATVDMVTAIDGRTAAGTVAIGRDQVVTVTPAQGAAVTFQLDELSDVQLAHPPAAPAASPGVHVWLRSGNELQADTVAGVTAEGQPPAVRLTTQYAGEITIPIRHIAALRWLRAEEIAPGGFSRDLAAPHATQDYLYVLKEGKAQRFNITVDHFAEGVLHFSMQGSNYQFDIPGVQAVVFGKNTGFAPDRQPLPRATLELVNGMRLNGRLLELGDNCTLRLDEGAELAIARRLVHRMSVRSDRVRYLSDMTPQVEQVPAFDRIWPWTVDRSPAGPGIKLLGTEFAQGVVMVPKTKLTYTLEQPYDLFEAMIGIEDRGGDQAHAIFRVYLDGKLEFESEPITRSSKPQRLQIAVTGKKQLAIEADFGKNFDLGDHCAFADARLRRK